MGPFLAGLLCFSSLGASPLLFMSHQGRHEEVAKILRSQDKIDENIIEQMALQMLRQGITSNQEEALLALFGASIALNEDVEDLFVLAWNTPIPPLQLAALNMISRSKTETSLHVLNQALGMPHPLIRLEAAFLMAERRAPQASIKIESLMHKIEPEAHFLFPQLFAMIGDDIAKKNLRKLLIHKDEKVRCEAILSIAKSGRDDLGRDIRRALTHPDALSKEVAATAAGILKDTETLTDLKRLSQNPSPTIKVAALRSMAILNDKEAESKLKQIALSGDLFAIYALGNFEGSQETLAELLDHPQPNVRLNATLALLGLKDKRCVSGLSQILLKDNRDLSFLPISSPAGSLIAYRIIPSSRQNLEEQQAAYSLSLKLREDALTALLELDDDSFYQMASILFERHQTELIPLLVDLIESRGGEKAETFLRYEEQRAGAPFIRAWAALALFRMKAEGPFEENLCRWVKDQTSIDLINFKPFVPWDKREGSRFELTPNEKNALWISTLEALIFQNPDKAIHLILDMLAQGAGKNRYILAGLLLRAIQ